MCTTTTIDQVKNYQGTNQFILNLKAGIQNYGSLTTKQAEAAQKVLSGQVVKIDMENLSPEYKKIVDYPGTNKFVLDIKDKFQKYGTLTNKQLIAVTNQIEKEEQKNKKVKVKLPTPGQTIKIGRVVGQGLKEKYGLEFNPILIDITKIIGVSPKAVQVQGKLTVKRGKVCQICAKTLTDEFSMLTGVGKTCAKHMKIEYITDKSQADEFRERYLKRVEEVGEFEFWAPYSQIKEWSDVDTTKEYVDMVMDALQPTNKFD